MPPPHHHIGPSATSRLRRAWQFIRRIIGLPEVRRDTVAAAPTGQASMPAHRAEASAGSVGSWFPGKPRRSSRPQHPDPTSTRRRPAPHESAKSAQPSPTAGNAQRIRSLTTPPLLRRRGSCRPFGAPTSTKPPVPLTSGRTAGTSGTARKSTDYRARDSECPSSQQPPRTANDATPLKPPASTRWTARAANPQLTSGHLEWRWHRTVNTDCARAEGRRRQVPRIARGCFEGQGHQALTGIHPGGRHHRVLPTTGTPRTARPPSTTDDRHTSRRARPSSPRDDQHPPRRAGSPEPADHRRPREATPPHHPGR
ncbi:hypothetical protein H4W80_009523 [Nonomuraea angiospora]|uniref:Uncharacterized protein n=1 Tax=Nonomuraea angiospora TaxID=46172 RepID=A0ABR9MFA5_9ACTN|nr:hypothetical protein [Nonomuraea angiospora]